MEVNLIISAEDAAGPIEVRVGEGIGGHDTISLGDIYVEFEGDTFERLTKAILRHWFTVQGEYKVDEAELLAMLRDWITVESD